MMLELLMMALFACGSTAEGEAGPPAQSDAVAREETPPDPAVEFATVELEAFTVAFSEGRLSDDVGQGFMAHMQRMAAADFVPSNGQVWGAYFGDPSEVGPENVIFHACSTLPEGKAVPDGVQTEELGGGLYLRAQHVGPYEELGRTYGAAQSWLAGQDSYTQREGPSLEHYYSDPMSTPAAEMITYVYLPLAPAE